MNLLIRTFSHSLVIVLLSSCAAPSNPKSQSWPVDPASGALSPVSLTIPDLELDLIPIPSGSFIMGSLFSEPGREDNEGPLTKVKITGGFWLGKTEVTQSQWHAIMGRTIQDQFYKDEHQRKFKIPGEGPTHPIYSISYVEIIEFCQKLTAREQAARRLPPNYAFTLPSEAQWEYACRAGSSSPLPAEKLDSFVWYKANSGETCHPVATKLPNAWGLYDMLGNVGEWCYDYYAPKLPLLESTDFTGPASGHFRVVRGGSYAFDANRCRPAVRFECSPSSSWGNLGFRLALVRLQ